MGPHYDKGVTKVALIYHPTGFPPDVTRALAGTYGKGKASTKFV